MGEKKIFHCAWQKAFLTPDENGNVSSLLFEIENEQALECLNCGLTSEQLHMCLHALPLEEIPALKTT